jgi:hypothetical protein
VTVLVVLEGLVIVLLTVLVAGLLRSHAEILRTLHELGVAAGADRGSSEPTIDVRPGLAEPRRAGSSAAPAADVAGVDPSGNPVQVAVVGPGRVTLLAFLSSGCLTCRDFWESLGRPSVEIPAGARPVIVTKGPEAESQSAVARLAPRGVPTVMSTSAWDAYEVPLAPYVMLVDGDRSAVVGEGAATTWTQVRHLLEQALADSDLAGSDLGRRDRASDRTLPHLTGAEREARADAELRAAGIEPGHTSLHPAPTDGPEARR